MDPGEPVSSCPQRHAALRLEDAAACWLPLSPMTLVVRVMICSARAPLASGEFKHASAVFRHVMGTAAQYERGRLALLSRLVSP